MALKNGKGSNRTTDSLTESYTHTRPDPSTKAPILRRGSGTTDKPASGEKSKP